MKILSKHAHEEDICQFLKDSENYKTQGDINDANAVLQISSTANKDLNDQIRSDNDMCQALMEIMSDEIKERENIVTTVTRDENLRNLMIKLNLSTEQAMDVLDIPTEDRHPFLLNT